MFSPSTADATRALRAVRREQQEQEELRERAQLAGGAGVSSSSSGGGAGKQALYAELTHNSLPFPALSELEAGRVDDHTLLGGLGVGKQLGMASADGVSAYGAGALGGSQLGVAHTRSSSRGASYRGTQAGRYVSPTGVTGRSSPPSRGRSSTSPVDGAPSRCNCKKSKCLKLYCECFASLRYCAGCNCHDCNNTKAHETAREGAIKATRERNSSAFVTKVNSNRGHATGCHCKNSLCLKKYCECFQAGAYCASNCKCLSCQNFSGSASLDAIKGAADRGSDKKRKGSPTSVAAVGDVYSPPLEAAPPMGVMMHSHSHSHSHSLSLRGSSSSSSSSSGGGGEVVVDDSGLNMPLLPLYGSSDDHAALMAPGTLGGGPGAGLTFSGGAFSAAIEADEHAGSYAGSGADSGSCIQDSPQKRPRRDGSGPPADAEAMWKVVYPFFGASRPPTSKRVAMGVLDHCSDKDLYALSQVSSYWARAAMDDSIWVRE